MKKIVFSMAVSLLVLILLPASVIASPSPADPWPEKKQLAIGFYEVSVFKNGRWQHAGSLTYEKHLRKKQIDLSRLLPAEGEARQPAEEARGLSLPRP